MSKLPTAEQIQHEWNTDPRWAGIQRNYSAADVVRLRGTVHVEHSLARLGAEKLWKYLHEKDFVNALGALTGNQAMQQVKAGLKAIYLSGWQVAADANLGGACTPTSRCTRPIRAGGGQANQQRAAARRPDRAR
jgi:isocitrate lyase